MSSPSPSPSRLPRVAPRIAQRALERARLTVVPRPRTVQRAPRVPFVMLISAILLGGVLGLLFFNTSMQQASFRETALGQQARDLSAQQEALQLNVDKLSDPQRIARQAQHMGMVIPVGSSGILNYDTGKISGVAAPAVGGRLPLGPIPARRPADFSPKPVKVPATTGARPGTTSGKPGSTTGSTTGSATGSTTTPKPGGKGAGKGGAGMPGKPTEWQIRQGRAEANGGTPGASTGVR